MGLKEAGNEKRKNKRVPITFDLMCKVNAPVEVRLKVGDKDVYATTFDISEGGIAIVTDKQLTVSAELDLSFHLIFPDHQTPPMSAIGRVRYIAVSAGKKGYRVGIEFIKIDEEDRKAISDFVHKRFSL